VECSNPEQATSLVCSFFNRRSNINITQAIERRFTRLKIFFRKINDFVHRTFVDFTVLLLILSIYIVYGNNKMVKSTVKP
jgi:hypothetical protein